MQNPEFILEKVIKRAGDKLFVKWECYNKSFNSWIDKKRYSIKEWILFFKLKPLGGLNLYNYAAKADIINAKGVDTSKFGKGWFS